MNDYMALQGNYRTDSEQFFIYRDGSSVMPQAAHKVLKYAISQLGLDADVYNFHSLWSGKATDMIAMGYSIEEIKRLGR